MEPTGSTLDMQMESVERSTVFLRQEHLTLLHGLHLEILSLQKRCSELTCELNVKPPGKSELDLAEEEEQLEARCLEVEDRRAEQQCTLGELCKELTHKGALVGALRANLKDKERRFLDELKRRSQRSTVLNTQLQRQSEAAAYLSFQLHAARQKLQHSRGSRPSGRTGRIGIVIMGIPLGPSTAKQPSGTPPSFLPFLLSRPPVSPMPPTPALP
ncbi:coiled-coil domain-containing protein 92 [Salmo trutta]|uniref:Coiled-coil domain containing 92Ba n=1 Tax=Salmo trutta TaxID=8032 RepID=A0A674CKT7_SALTR|nr:coiled-coil domain-containing protein 92-like [Salmo trutta]